MFNRRYRQTIGIFVICFLLNDVSIAEEGNGKVYTITATNVNGEPEGKSSNRRSSVYYPPEPSRVLTPPRAGNPMSYDQTAYASDHYTHTNYWNNELPIPDAYTDESASYLTIIKPKTSPNPYATTLYNKDVRQSIYHLAANVNSLESSDKKNQWIHSILQKEVTHQPQPTTPQVVVAYTPHVFYTTPTKFNKGTESTVLIQASTLSESELPTTTTTTERTTTTADSSIALLRAAIIPTRAPMYLIIQGHSKVKTYGADHVDDKAIKHEAKMVPVTTVKDPIVKHVVSEDTNGNEIQVKHLHKLQTPAANHHKVKTTTPSSMKKVTNSAMESLLSLLDKSFGGFAMNAEKETKTKETKKGGNFDLKNLAVPTDVKKNSGKKTTISIITGPTTLRALNETRTS